MTEGMPSVSHRKRLRYALAAAAVVVAPVLLPTVAAAQEPAGRTVVGELVRALADHRAGHEHGDEHGHEHAEGAEGIEGLTWVETDDGETVRLSAADAADLPSGATVEVTVGNEIADEARDEGLGPAVELLDSEVVLAPVPPRPVPPRPFTNEVTVALVAPGGAPRDRVTLAQVVDTVDGAAARFWDEQSDGAISLGVTDSHGWTTTAAGCEDPGAMWAQAADKVGFRSGPGKHLLLYVSGAAKGCSYGLAQVGAAPSTGGRAYVTDVLPSLIAHEIGHNFGLGHSSALFCAHGAEAGGCDVAHYRDHYDVMGASWDQIGSLNVLQADRLGVLPDAAVHTVRPTSGAAQVTLAPLTGDGVRALRLVDPRGREYWLELRTATGQDAWLGGRDNVFGLQAGVLVRRSGTWPDTSLLLDPTPGSGRQGDFQVALPAGRTVTLGAGAFQVTVGETTADGVTVDVRTVAQAAGQAASAPADPHERPGATETPETLPVTDVAAPDVAAPQERVSEAEPQAAEGPVDTAAAAAAPVAADVPVDGPAAAAQPQPAAQPVATASPVRTVAVPAAGAVLGCSAFVLVRRLIRGRASR